MQKLPYKLPNIDEYVLRVGEERAKEPQGEGTKAYHYKNWPQMTPKMVHRIDTR